MHDLKPSSRILITGGAGFIGSAVVHELARLKRDVCVVARSGGSLGRLSDIRHVIDVVSADLEIEGTLSEVVRNGDTVAHLAAFKRNIRFHREHPAKVLEANVRMTANVFHAAQARGVGRMLILSSSRADPSWLSSVHFGYAWGKRIGEVFAEAYAREYGMRTLAVRVENTFGPGDSFGMDAQVIPALIERATAGERPLRIAADPDEMKHFSFVDDVARAVVELLGSASVGIIRLAPSYTVTFRELGTAVARAVDPACVVTFDPPSDRVSTGNQPAQEAVPTHTVSPQKSFETAIRETVRWYHANPHA